MSFILPTLLAFVLLNGYLAYRLLRWTSLRSRWTVPITLLFGGTTLLYLLLFQYRYELSEGLNYWGIHFVTIWLIFQIYATIALSAFDLLAWLGRRSFDLTTDRLRRLRPWCTLLTTLAIVGVLIYGYYESYDVQLVRYDVDLRKDTTQQGETMTVVLISDLHIGANVQRSHVADYVDRINALRPDLVLMAGDIVDHDLHVAITQHVEEELSRLQAPLGVYGILGNHAYRSWVDAKLRWFDDARIAILRDSAISVAGYFTLVGRDDFVNGDRHSVRQLLEGVDRSRPIVVMDHQPLFPNEMMMNHVQLALYGHTHAGQIWPHNWLVSMVMPISYGLAEKGGTVHIVTSGLGVSGPPLRIGSHSEIVQLTLRLDAR